MTDDRHSPTTAAPSPEPATEAAPPPVSPPQIVSTTYPFACSYSSSPRGRTSKIQPVSTCSIAP